MPVTKLVGTPSEANTKIGGVPAIHYFDFASKGRGEVLRSFFEDAQIAFNDVRYEFGEINGKSVDERALKNPVGSVPYLSFETKDGEKILSQSYPILRLLARQLGEYDGKTSEEMYLVDVVNDISLDWRSVFVSSAFVVDAAGINGNPEASPFQKHKDFTLRKYCVGIEGHLTEGPFILGERISYADFVLYQIYHDEREIGGKIEEILEKECPKLKKLVTAFEARPRIAAYQKSARYFN